MKKFTLTLVATAFASSLSLAQYVGTPADVGLIPRTPTIDVNTNYNNNNLETGGIVITANTNVVVGWEDDFSTESMDYWGATFVVYDRNGSLLSPNAVVTTTTPGAPCPDVANGPTLTTTYRSFFRADGSATPSYAAWGAKPKANLFGNGFGLGGSGDVLGCEIPQIAPIMDAAGGSFPAVQFLNNDGSRDATIGGPDVAGIVTFADADVEPVGSVRMGDWERLSNGNVVLVGESRQVDDRLLTGQLSGNVVVYKVLNSAGGVVKALSVATSEVAGDATVGQEMWHGVAVTANGFAIRFGQGGTKIRLFDNNGNPTTANINLAAVTGYPEAGGGGRGDSTGFNGNGKNAYVYACPSAVGPWVTVLNADGTVRYSRQVTDPGVLGTGGNSDRMGAGISEDGRVVVAFQAANTDTNNTSLFGLPQARLFDPCGRPIGPVFYLSERETPANAIASNGGDGRPRVAFRGNTIAAMWGSLNSPITTSTILALRIFDVGPPPPSLDPVVPCNAESVGLKRIVPDTVVWFSTSENRSKIGGYVEGDQPPMGSSVEATAGVLGDSTFLLAATTQATNDSSLMSFTSVLIPANGSTPKLDNLFYTDAGTPWLKGINLSRQTGNPGRIGGDPRYGAVNYGGAGEVSLFAYPEFNSDGRFSNPFFDDANARLCRSYGGQLHRLDPVTLASTPLMKAIDTMFGRLWTNTVAPAGGQDFGRTGSSPIGLDNGNFVFVGEDRTTLNTEPGGPRAAIATIVAPNGTIVKEAFRVTPVPTSDGSMWNSVGAFKGGFFVRPAGGIIYFYNNAGDLQGTLDHNAASGLNYDLGRSDGTRMCSDIRSHYVFQAGKAPESGFTNIMLTAYDANTRTWITNTIVSEGTQDTLNTGGTRLLDRANVACDAYNRVTVIYRVRPDRTVWLNDQVAARVFQFDGTKFTPLTPSFFPFSQHDAIGNNAAGFKQVEPSVAMTPREILFYAKGFWNTNGSPTNVVSTLDNTHCYTILSHPAPMAAPIPTMTITKSGSNVDVSWNSDAGLFTVQTRSSLTSGSWANATAGNVAPPVSVPIGAGPLYFRLAR